MKRLLLIVTVLIATGQAHAQNWSLVWADEFNGTSLNLADWNHDLGTGSQYGLTGWGNNELQYYRSENVEVSGGNLKISALQENYMGMNYTSGKIHTKTKRFYTHGKIEARMQVPTDQGMWPAFWMLTEPGDLAQNAASWPPELDIMETVGHTGNTTFGTAHYGTWPTVISNGGQYTVPSGDLSSTFHTYTVEWYPDNIAWYFDGILIHELNSTDVSPEAWQFNQDFFLIFNLAVGGSWPGSPDGSTTFPEEMLVDWVRVYSYDDTETTDVTFRVDMSEQTLAPTDIVHVNGTWNDWCGACNPMTDIGNGIWEVTLPIPPGVQEYKFTTNGWTGLEEAFAGGESCTITTGAFTNRGLNVQFDPLDLTAVCFDSCSVCPGSITEGCMDVNAANYVPSALTDDGSCVYDVTFSVDMNDYAGGFTVAEVHANFNGWCVGCNPMTDVDLDGIWELTLQLPIGNFEFLYSLDNLENLESFSGSDACVIGFDPFWNRELIITGATTLSTVCFDSCSACPILGCTDPAYLEYDDLAVSDDGSCATLVVSGCIYSVAENFNSLANTDDGTCTFGPVNTCPGDFDGNLSINTADLLAFLTFFGTTCN